MTQAAGFRRAGGSRRRRGSLDVALLHFDRLGRHLNVLHSCTGNAAMWSYILKRLLLMIPTVLGVLTLTFAVIQFVPGGPVEQMAHELRRGSEGGVPFGLRAHSGVDAQQIAQLKALYGFDKPPLVRYGLMLKRFATFDLGQSYFRHQSVWSLVRSKLPVSISIGLWTFFLTYLISVPLGIAKAIRNGSHFDFVTSLIVLIGYAIPGFVLGVLLLVLFGGGSFLQLFPLRGLTSDNWAQLSLGGKILDYLWHITLPIVASVVGSFAVITMLTKNAFLDEIRKQYVLTARAKGLSERRVLWKHVFRNASLPLIVGFPGAFIGAFFTGSLLIETLFSLDGLGLLSYQSVVQRDYPVVLGTLYLFTLIGLATKLISDLCYVWVDPRIQFEQLER
jgi:microcin C transport system permease protein